MAAVTRAVQMEISRITLELDESTADDQRRLAQLYRHGRVLRQSRRGGRLSVEAEVPSRMAVRWSGVASR